MIGRANELARIRAAVAHGATRLVLVPGRGGIGKTRLLRAVAEDEEDDGLRTVFSREAAALTLDNVRTLPSEPLMVVVDDAHQQDLQLTPLLAEAHRRTEPITIVCAVRPGGIDLVRAHATSAGLDSTQIVVLPALEALKHGDAEELASTALGESSPASKRLADAGALTPLITVLGANLLNRDAITDPAGTHATFRSAILLRFTQEQLGAVTPSVPPEQARALATIVAALQPLDLADAQLVSTIGDELGVVPSQVRRWLGDLRRAGLLLARGEHRRITPEVLAEELLYAACVDAAGRPTGYADELWKAYGAMATESLITNLAELDGRTAQASPSPLDGVWAEIERRFDAAGLWERSEMLTTLTRAACAVPVRALGIAQRATNAFVADSAQNGAKGVLMGERTAVMLRAIGQHPGRARDAMMLLWSLAQNDRRPTHSHPEHALRIAQELGGYESSLAHNEALLDVVETTLSDPQVDTWKRSPVELLESILAREGTTTREVGMALQFGSYTVNAEVTLPLRRRIRALLVATATTASPRQARCAAALFNEALALPHGFFNHPVPPEVLASWANDQDELLDAISAIERTTQDVVVRHELAQALTSHVAHDPLHGISARAAALVARLEGPEEETVTALAHPWSMLDPLAKQARDARVASRLIFQSTDSDELATALDTRLADIAGRGGQPEVRAVLLEICRQSPTHAEGVWRWALAHTAALLTQHADVAIDQLRRAGSQVEKLFASAWAGSETTGRRLAAAYLCEGAWFSAPEPFEHAALEQTITDSDPVVRSITATTILRLRASDPARAARLALQAPVETGTHDIDMLFATLDDIGVEQLSAPELDLLADRLATVPKLEHFAVALLSALGAAAPHRAIDIWRRRLLTDNQSGFRAVPHLDRGAALLADASNQQQQSLVSDLLTGMETIGYLRARDLGALLWRMAVPGLNDQLDAPNVAELVAKHAASCSAVQNAVTAWIAGPEAPADVVSGMLSQLQWQLLLASPAWVHDLLQATQGEIRAGVLQGLHAAAFGGGHSRTVGEASQRLLRTKAAAAAAPADSAAASFFTEIAQIAQGEMDTDRRRDDEEQAGWS